MSFRSTINHDIVTAAFYNELENISAAGAIAKTAGLPAAVRKGGGGSVGTWMRVKSALGRGGKKRTGQSVLKTLREDIEKRKATGYRGK